MPISTAQAALAPYVQLFASQVSARPLLTASAIGAVPLISYVIHSYRGFLALGPGGLPRNFLGWALQASLQLLSRHNVTSTALYRDPSVIAAHGSHGRTSFLGAEPLPARQGDRPIVPGYVAPQRQTTEKGDEALISRLNAFLFEVASSGETLEMKPSGLEGKDSVALFLKDHTSLPDYIKRTKGELAHVHSEASSHMVLSLPDAESAIRLGWAQRHKLSGVLGLPLGYVMVYAPRDEVEYEVWGRFVLAAVAFATAEAELKAT